MENETTIPDHSPDLKEEDLKREEDLIAAAKRRDAYSLVRDVQANNNNEAIARRLAKEEKSKGEDKK